MRIRLTAVTALAIVLAVIAASPATAATNITRARMVHSLLTAHSLGEGWHKFNDSSSDSPDSSTITGCAANSYESVGVKREVDLDFQYEQLPLFVAEGIQAFRSDALAKADFTKGVNLFAKCEEFTVDGKVWKIARLALPKYADQQAMFRISGMVATETGDVKLTRFMVVSRHGRQQVAVLLTAAGNDITPAISRTLARSSVRVSRLATAKVVDALGR